MKNTNFRASRVFASAAGSAKAFTLAELLMAVLVISIIMVALAPVITRRAYDNVSIEVNKKKGLEIYTNPGTYSFDVPVGINTLFLQGSGGGGGGAGATYIDKSVSYSSNTTWTVPGGVNQITFTITGAGGGGGAGNGTAVSDSCTNAKNNQPLSFTYPVKTIIRGNSDERDICFIAENLKYVYKGTTGSASYNLEPGTECNYGGKCCWNRALTKKCTTWPQAGCYTEVNVNGVMQSGANRPICQYTGARELCGWLGTSGEALKVNSYNVPTPEIWTKINKNFEYWAKELNMTVYCSSSGIATNKCINYVPTVGLSSNCIGALGNYCHTGWYWAYNSQTQTHFVTNHTNAHGVSETGQDLGASVRCYKVLNRYNRYSGAGGASGAQYKKTINVLPGDQLVIVVGTGGAAGKYNTNVNNGLGARLGNGGRGNYTQITHKRGSVTMGIYKVLGGFGGWAATASANGSAIANGTASNQTTPSGVCYAQYRKETTDALTGGSTSCTTLSYSGNAGSSSAGGLGGRVKNTGTATAGGTLFIDNARTPTQRNTTTEANKAKGQNATVQGFGGGGGLTPAWVTNTSHFYQGGTGASGKVDISYRVSLPGGGGGSATRVGGTKRVAEKDTMYEIRYKVDEGSRVVFKIGSGGTGGVANQDGISGEATTIGNNEVVFLGGEGGKVSTTAQKNSLLGGSGGRASYIDENNDLNTNTLGLKVTGNKVSYTIAAPSGGFKGENGYQGQLKNSSNVLLNYGFDGGLGGSPFNIPSNLLNSSRTCGGGTKGASNSTAACPNNMEDGNRAIAHDPVNNQFGGSGGGGGGVVKDTFTLGQGGSGSSGYLRIRWDESDTNNYGG